VIRRLYLDGLDIAQASQNLGITEAELRARHRTALRTIKSVVLD
jgi:DNA-directed RNA polymerase specialized sigma24 family protein